MSKHRYFFNPESLSYHKVVPTLKKRIIRIASIVMSAAVISTLYYIGYSLFFDTPVEKHLKRENKLLTEQYKLLDKRFDQVDRVVKDLQERDGNIYRVIFEVEPYKDTVFLAGGNFALRLDEIEDKDNNDLINQSIDILKRIREESAPKTIVLLQTVEKMVEKQADSLRYVPSIIPLENKDVRQFAAPQGVRIHPFYKVLRMHEGVDLASPTGSPVLAAADGVVQAIANKRAKGNSILIDHGNGYTTFYAHLEKIGVRKGQRVKKGVQIGTVGSTGMSVAPHLHYEVKKNNQLVNPVHFFFADISPNDYRKLIDKASLSGQSLD